MPDSETNHTGNYHHGNLREALLHAAVLAIREKGPENLSLRAVARRVGVSQTAPYRHFADKNDLLAELARQTFDELTAVTSAHISPGTSAEDNLFSAGEAYIRYAISNPEKYRLVFGNTIANRQSYPQLCDSGNRSFTVLVELIESGIRSGEFTRAEPRLLANLCWSSIHGFASLCIDGIFDRIEHSWPLDDMIRSQVRLTIRAITAAPAASL
ncbi:MAG: TetR/AcrR family transcriptional regulator [Pseudomonadota bacterium]|nr:TetR/AcrR family transcriptional regulator [Pseudomonadota bacterium]